MTLTNLLPVRLRLAWLALRHNGAQLRAALEPRRRPLFRSDGRAGARGVRPALHPSEPTVAAATANGEAPPTRVAARATRARPADRATELSYRVHYRRSGATLDVPPEGTLLGAALDADLDLAHACQMGMCGTCKSRLLSGEVQMDEPNTLSEEERARGFCLPCVSHPRSAIELDA